MDFITLDFETATPHAHSPCEIGMTFVSDGKITGTYSRLIRPPGNIFDYKNIRVHGIKPADVMYEPGFDEIWNEIAPMLHGAFLIAHNASFDFGVLRKTLDFYSLPYPFLQYACSVQISRKVWTGLTHYNLKALCEFHGIPLNHHRAEADSLATAQLCMKAFEHADIFSPEEIPEKLQASVWKMEPSGHVRFR